MESMFTVNEGKNKEKLDGFENGLMLVLNERPRELKKDNSVTFRIHTTTEGERTRIREYMGNQDLSYIIQFVNDDVFCITVFPDISRYPETPLARIQENNEVRPTPQMTPSMPSHMRAARMVEEAMAILKDNGLVLRSTGEEGIKAYLRGDQNWL
jgi:hypothetical protein